MDEAKLSPMSALKGKVWWEWKAYKGIVLAMMVT